MGSVERCKIQGSEWISVLLSVVLFFFALVWDFTIVSTGFSAFVIAKNYLTDAFQEFVFFIAFRKPVNNFTVYI